MHILKYITKFIFIILLLTIFAGVVALQTPWAKNKIAAEIEKQLDTKISNLSGFLPFSPYIGTLELKDSLGIWLEAENVSIKWGMDFFPLSFQISSLNAEKLNFLRMPEESGNSSSDSIIPEIRINKITLPHIKIDKAITGQDLIFTMEGRLHISEEKFLGTLQISIPEISQFYTALRGKLEAEIKLSGTLSAPQAKINASLKDENKILKLATLLQVNNDLLEFTDINAETTGLNITGTLAYNTETELSDGRLNINANNLAGLSPFLTSDIGGTGEALINLKNIDGKQSFDAQGKLQGLVYADTSVESLIFNLNASDLFAMAGLNADIQVANIKNAETIIENLTINAKGSSKNTDLVIAAKAIGTMPWEARIHARLESTLADWKFHVDKLQGNVDGNKIAIITPAIIAKTDDKFSMQNMRLKIAEGSLRAEGFYSQQNVNLKITPSNLPLVVLTNNQFNGKLNGNINVTGIAATPKAAFDLRVTGLAANLGKEGGFTLNLKGALEPDTLSLNATIADIQGKSYADLKIPAQFSLSPFNIALPPDGNISGTLNINSKINQFITLFLPADHKLSGNANGIFNIGGKLNKPLVTGKISLKNAQYENLSTGTILKNMQVQLEAKQERIEIINGTAQAGKGRVNLSGYIGLGAGHPISIQAFFKEAQIVNMREATGTVNGKVQVSGDITSPLIAGNLAIGPMEIRLPEGSEVNVPQVKIRNPKILPKQVWEKEQEQKSRPANVKLNLKIEIPARVFVRGRGLDTEIRGAVTIKGTMAEPEIEGKFQSLYGTYVLLDRELKITEGTLTFRGAMPPSPYLVLLAETTTKELSTGVRIEGSIHSPELTLTSTPQRPEDEIMAHLLFGRSLASITPLQGIQLAQAIQKLRGKGGGVDFLGKARNLLGIQRLSVGETDSGKFGVEAGKYITDKIYIGVEGGAEPEAGKVKAEIEVSPRFSVETETGGRSSGARFNWKRDY